MVVVGKGGMGETRYRKDLPIDELAAWVKRIEFDLPTIAVFDLDEGMAALRDALRRKAGAKRPA